MSRKRKSRERAELVGALREISGQLAHLVRALDRCDTKVVVRGDVGQLVVGDYHPNKMRAKVCQMAEGNMHNHQAPPAIR